MPRKNDNKTGPAGKKVSSPKKAKSDTAATKNAKPVKSSGTSREAVTSAGKKASGSKAPRSAGKDGFPVVGIGASAGGLEAYEHFFTAMPTDSGMAFVLIPHLDPTHKSLMSDLVGRQTGMDVVEVKEGMMVRPNHVYVIPPNKGLEMSGGKLWLKEPEAQARGPRHPIDSFFRSLAQDMGERAIAIVFSGTGSEGALGIKAVKGEGGLVLVQDPATAKYSGMPENAIGTGLVDFVLPVDKMPEQLLGFMRREAVPYKEERPDRHDLIMKAIAIIRHNTSHDFSQYKLNTVIRRIERRMAVNKTTSLPSYVDFLKENPQEVGILFRELLIRVTNFFRDPEAFTVLKETGFPLIFKDRPDDVPVRIWVPGCSTGEEAYSIAIAISEYMEENRLKHSVQIFASDIDGGAIDAARIGAYSEGISVDVSPERLRRYFVRKGNEYKVRDNIREMVVFALQNLVKDPPFSRLDMVSCRNLLIYLSPALQKKVFPVFHYALRPNGLLFLGTSESVGERSDLFSIVDKKSKLFRAANREAVTINQFEIGMPITGHEAVQPPLTAYPPARQQSSVGHYMSEVLLHRYTPPGLIISDAGDIFFIHGKTGRYLEPAEGRASLNVFEMSREGLGLELQAGVRRAVVRKGRVELKGLSVKTNGGYQDVDVEINYISEPEHMRGLLMMLFRDVAKEKPEKARPSGVAKDKAGTRRIHELENELKSMKEHLRTTIEELETSNEELKSTNEEFQSSNEELQSTNEELETSKEELQSVNEELLTVNAEYQHKIDELSEASNDMNNLLASTQVATIFLDKNLKIRRFTPTAKSVINLIDTDIGRPISDIVTKLDYPKLVKDIEGVLETLVLCETEVQDRSGHWYASRILPYRMSENRIEGVVITFTDITDRKIAQKELTEKHTMLEDILRQMPDDVTLASRAGLGVRDAVKEGWELLKADGKAKPSVDELPLTRAVRGEIIRDEKWVIKGTGGGGVDVYCSAEPLVDKNGAITGGIIGWRLKK